MFIFTFRFMNFQPWYLEDFPTNNLQVLKVAIKANWLRQNKVSSAQETAETKLFRHAIQIILCFVNICVIKAGVPQGRALIHPKKGWTVFFNLNLRHPILKFQGTNLMISCLLYYHAIYINSWSMLEFYTCEKTTFIR